MKLFAKNLLKGAVFFILFFVVGIYAGITANIAHAETVTYWSDEGKRADSFAGGTGTKDDPYQIATPGQLGYLEYITDVAVDANRRQTDDEAQKGKYFKITADLDMSGASWMPIGRHSSLSNYFQGNLDGGNHTISNLDHSLIGYYLCRDGQELKNITIKDSTFGFDRNLLSTYTGGLIAYCTNPLPGSFSNIHIYSEFDGKKIEKKATDTEDWFKAYVGGFIGYVTSGKWDFVMENCGFYGSLDTTQDVTSEAGYYDWDKVYASAILYNYSTPYSGSVVKFINTIVDADIKISNTILHNSYFLPVMSGDNYNLGGEIQGCGINISRIPSGGKEDIRMVTYTDDMKASGEATYLLNESAKSPVFGQELGVDAGPKLGGKLVDLVDYKTHKYENVDELHTCKDHLTKVDEKEPTDSEDGNIEYNICDYCGKCYDREGDNRLSQGQIIIPSLVWDGSTVLDYFAGGSGTEEDPYLIYSASQLAHIKDVKQSAYYKQIRDIDFGGHTWKPVSSSIPSYKIYYDGNGKLFRNTHGMIFEQARSIKNVTVENGKFADIEGFTYAGSIVGSCTEISNCTSSAKYEFSIRNRPDLDIGGIAGYASSAVNCTFEGTISLSACNNIGGIVGNTTSGNLTNCDYKGQIEVDQCTNIGGIAGQSSSTAQDLESTGRVTVNTKAESAGGILGKIDSIKKVMSSSFEGTGTMDITGATYVGGIVGKCFKDNQIVECKNTGTILVKDSQYVGGIVGYHSTYDGKTYDSDIHLCLFEGNILATNSENVAGIVAEIHNKARVYSSIFKGTIHTDGSTYVAGIVALDGSTSSAYVTLQYNLYDGNIQNENLSESGSEALFMNVRREYSTIILPKINDENTNYVTASSAGDLPLVNSAYEKQKVESTDFVHDVDFFKDGRVAYYMNYNNYDSDGKNIPYVNHGSTKNVIGQEIGKNPMPVFGGKLVDVYNNGTAYKNVEAIHDCASHLTLVPRKNATETEDGYFEHYECSECGEWYRDSLCSASHRDIMHAFDVKTDEEDPYFYGGDGSESNPYQIVSASSLKLMARLVNEGDAAYTKAHYKLVRDITVYKGEFPGIGSDAYPFEGTFDGNEHIIKGFTIGSYSSKTKGFFYAVKNAVIKNLMLDGILTKFRVAGGILCGKATNSVFSNCLCTGNVRVDVTSLVVGGIVGEDSACTFSGCGFSGSSNCANWGALVGKSSAKTQYVGCYTFQNNSGTIPGTGQTTLGFVGSPEGIYITSFTDCVSCYKLPSSNTYYYTTIVLYDLPRTLDGKDGKTVDIESGYATYGLNMATESKAVFSQILSGDGKQRWPHYYSEEDKEAKLATLVDYANYGKEFANVSSMHTCVENLEHHDYKKNTKEEDGHLENWQCTKCGKYFSDDKASKEEKWKDLILYKRSWDGVVADSFAGGNGTSSNPFIIENAAQLYYIDNYMNRSGSESAVTYFKITRDIYLYGDTRHPILNDTCKYLIDLDGTGHSIYGLKIADSSSDVGLFGRLRQLTVKNLTLEEDCEIRGLLNAKYAHTGAFVGDVNYGTGDYLASFTNCVVKAKVIGYGYVSGFAGYCGTGASDGCYVKNCVTYGRVWSADYKDSVNDYIYPFAFVDRKDKNSYISGSCVEIYGPENEDFDSSTLDDYIAAKQENIKGGPLYIAKTHSPKDKDSSEIKYVDINKALNGELAIELNKKHSTDVWRQKLKVDGEEEFDRYIKSNGGPIVDYVGDYGKKIGNVSALHTCNDNLEHRDRVEPTKTTLGAEEHEICKLCGKKFADTTCSKVLSDEEVRIGKIGAWDGKTISTSLEGSGTKEDPYQIASGADFEYMVKYSRDGSYYIQTQDINFDNFSKSKGGSFGGHYDGNKKVISGLRDALFFYLAQQASVENVIIKDSVIKSYYGGISGDDDGDFHKPLLAGSITNFGYGSNISSYKLVIKNCYSTAKIQPEIADEDLGRKVYIGGLIAATSATNLEMENCWYEDNTDYKDDYVRAPIVAKASYTKSEIKSHLYKNVYGIMRQNGELQPAVKSIKEGVTKLEGMIPEDRIVKAFESGEIAYNLCGANEDEDTVWGQKLGVDKRPTFNENRVYYYDETYTNISSVDRAVYVAKDKLELRKDKYGWSDSDVADGEFAAAVKSNDNTEATYEKISRLGEKAPELEIRYKGTDETIKSKIYLRDNEIITVDYAEEKGPVYVVIMGEENSHTWYVRIPVTKDVLVNNAIHAGMEFAGYKLPDTFKDCKVWLEKRNEADSKLYIRTSPRSLTSMSKVYLYNIPRVTGDRLFDCTASVANSYTYSSYDGLLSPDLKLTWYLAGEQVKGKAKNGYYYVARFEIVPAASHYFSPSTSFSVKAGNANVKLLRIEDGVIYGETEPILASDSVNVDPSYIRTPDQIKTNTLTGVKTFTNEKDDIYNEAPEDLLLGFKQDESSETEFTPLLDGSKKIKATATYTKFGIKLDNPNNEEVILYDVVKKYIFKQAHTTSYFCSYGTNSSIDDAYYRENLDKRCIFLCKRGADGRYYGKMAEKDDTLYGGTITVGDIGASSELPNSAKVEVPSAGTPSGIGIKSLVWYNTLGEIVSGTAKAGEKYTLDLTVEPKDGFVFGTPDVTQISIQAPSGIERNVLSATKNEDGTITYRIAYDKLQYGNGKLLTDSSEFNVKNGLDILEIVEQLQKKAFVVRSTYYANYDLLDIVYDTSKVDYQRNCVDAQTITIPGKVTLPYYYDNAGTELTFNAVVHVEAGKRAGIPTANIKSGTTLNEWTDLTLSSDIEDAKIYYTLDGSEPNVTNKETTKLYDDVKKIQLKDELRGTKKDIVVKAIVVAKDLYNSEVAQFNYSVLRPKNKVVEKVEYVKELSYPNGTSLKTIQEGVKRAQVKSLPIMLEHDEVTNPVVKLEWSKNTESDYNQASGVTQTITYNAVPSVQSDIDMNGMISESNIKIVVTISKDTNRAVTTDVYLTKADLYASSGQNRNIYFGLSDVRKDFGSWNIAAIEKKDSKTYAALFSNAQFEFMTSSSAYYPVAKYAFDTTENSTKDYLRSTLRSRITQSADRIIPSYEERPNTYNRFAPDEKKMLVDKVLVGDDGVTTGHDYFFIPKYVQGVGPVIGLDDTVKVNGYEGLCRNQYERNASAVYEGLNGTSVSKTDSWYYGVRLALNIDITDVDFASCVGNVDGHSGKKISSKQTQYLKKIDNDSIDSDILYTTNNVTVKNITENDKKNGIVAVIVGNDGKNDWYYTFPISEKYGESAENIADELGLMNVPDFAKCKIWLQYGEKENSVWVSSSVGYRYNKTSLAKVKLGKALNKTSEDAKLFEAHNLNIQLPEGLKLKSGSLTQNTKYIRPIEVVPDETHYIENRYSSVDESGNVLVKADGQKIIITGALDHDVNYTLNGITQKQKIEYGKLSIDYINEKILEDGEVMAFGDRSKLGALLRFFNYLDNKREYTNFWGNIPDEAFGRTLTFDYTYEAEQDIRYICGSRRVINVPARPDGPEGITVSYEYKDGVPKATIMNIPEGCEMKTPQVDKYEDVSGDVVVHYLGRYEIRYKAKVDTFASNSRTFNIDFTSYPSSGYFVSREQIPLEDGVLLESSVPTGSVNKVSNNLYNSKGRIARMDGTDSISSSAIVSGSNINVIKAEGEDNLSLVVQGKNDAESGLRDWYYKYDITESTSISLNEALKTLGYGNNQNISRARVWIETNDVDKPFAKYALRAKDIRIKKTPVANMKVYFREDEKYFKWPKQVDVELEDRDGTPVGTVAVVVEWDLKDVKEKNDRTSETGVDFEVEGKLELDGIISNPTDEQLKAICHVTSVPTSKVSKIEIGVLDAPVFGKDERGNINRLSAPRTNRITVVDDDGKVNVYSATHYSGEWFSKKDGKWVPADGNIVLPDTEYKLVIPNLSFAPPYAFTKDTVVEYYDSQGNTYDTGKYTIQYNTANMDAGNKYTVEFEFPKTAPITEVSTFGRGWSRINYYTRCYEVKSEDDVLEAVKVAVKPKNPDEKPVYKEIKSPYGTSEMIEVDLSEYYGKTILVLTKERFKFWMDESSAAEVRIPGILDVESNIKVSDPEYDDQLGVIERINQYEVEYAKKVDGVSVEDIEYKVISVSSYTNKAEVEPGDYYVRLNGKDRFGSFNFSTDPIVVTIKPGAKRVTDFEVNNSLEKLEVMEGNTFRENLTVDNTGNMENKVFGYSIAGNNELASRLKLDLSDKTIPKGAKAESIGTLVGNVSSLKAGTDGKPLVYHATISMYYMDHNFKMQEKMIPVSVTVNPKDVIVNYYGSSSSTTPLVSDTIKRGEEYKLKTASAVGIEKEGKTLAGWAEDSLSGRVTKEGALYDTYSVTSTNREGKLEKKFYPIWKNADDDAEVIRDGRYSGITYKVYDTDGDRTADRLVFAGSGYIPGFEGSDSAPWNAYSSSINCIEIESGITGIARGAIIDFNQNYTIFIKGENLDIEDEAFYDTSGTVIYSSYDPGKENSWVEENMNIYKVDYDDVTKTITLLEDITVDGKHRFSIPSGYNLVVAKDKTLTVKDNVSIGGQLLVNGNVVIEETGTLSVSDACNVSGTLDVCGQLNIAKDLTIDGKIILEGKDIKLAGISKVSFGSKGSFEVKQMIDGCEIDLDKDSVDSFVYQKDTVQVPNVVITKSFGGKTSSIGSDLYEVTYEKYNNSLMKYEAIEKDSIVNCGKYQVVCTSKYNNKISLKYIFDIKKAKVNEDVPDNTVSSPCTAKKLSDVPLKGDWVWAESDCDKTFEVYDEFKDEYEIIELKAKAIYVGADKDNFETVEKVVNIAKPQHSFIALDGTCNSDMEACDGCGVKNIAYKGLDVRISNPKYNGLAQKPVVEIKSGKTVLAEGDDKDYKVSVIEQIEPADDGYEIIITGVGSYTGSFTRKWNIDKAEPLAEFFTYTKPTSLTYDGKEKVATVVVKDDLIGFGTFTVKYQEANATKMTKVAPTDAGTYDVYADVTEGAYYGAKAVKVGTFTIAKIASAVKTAPVAKEGLKYQGGADITLLDDSSAAASGGAFVYRLGETGEFTSDIPTAKNAGNYKVYYKVKGDKNHTDTEEMFITVSVAKTEYAYTKPMNLTAMCGQNLSDVTLPAGFVWTSEDVVLKADSDRDTNEIVKIAKYVPEDMLNYVESTNIAVTITLDHDFTDSKYIHVDGNMHKQKCKFCDGYSTPELCKDSLISVEKVDATCEAAGNKAYYKCSECDTYYADKDATEIIADKESVVIPAKKHSLSKVDKVDATCTTVGCKEYWKCTNEGCDKIFADKEGKIETTLLDLTIAVSGHIWNADYTIDVEATTTSTGSKSIHCAICDAIKEGSSVSIPQLPSETPKPTEKPSVTPEPTEKPSVTPGATEKPSVTPGATEKPSATPGATEKPSVTPGATEKPSVTPEPTEKPSVTPGATEKPSATPKPTDKPSVIPSKSPTANVFKVGDKVVDAKTKLKYKITSVGKVNTVSCLGISNKKATSVTIPATVKIAGKTYKVTSVASNAFKNNKMLTQVTIGSNVISIGKNAFKGCKKLKTITIKSKKLTAKGISKGAFAGLKKGTVIKVPKTKLKDYKKLFKSKGLSSKVKVK